MTPTPWNNLSIAGKISRKLKDISWEAARGIGKGVVMAPKNLFRSTSDYKWIESRKQEREKKRKDIAPETMGEGLHLRPRTNFSSSLQDDASLTSSVQMFGTSNSSSNESEPRTKTNEQIVSATAKGPELDQLPEPSPFLFFPELPFRAMELRAILRACHSTTPELRPHLAVMECHHIRYLSLLQRSGLWSGRSWGTTI